MTVPGSFPASPPAFRAPAPRARRDSRAWQLQVWISFAIAAALCGIGLAWLPGQGIERAFMVMGYVFCLTAVFVLAKFVRDREAAAQAEVAEVADTPLWSLVVWGGFAVAMGLTGWGLLRMAIDPTYKAFLGIGWLYLISAAFTLAKMLRDRHEADIADARARPAAATAPGPTADHAAAAPSSLAADGR